MALPPQRQTRPRTLGPCFTCGMIGHLARTCPTEGRHYPLYQPVVSSESSKLSGNIHGVNSCIAEITCC